MGVLTSRSTNINLSDEEFCEALGFLAREGRMRIEAQVPYAKKNLFERIYPGQDYYLIKPWANKQSFQLRILMKSINNCPKCLVKHITLGGGHDCPGCISRGLFVENIVENFDFRFQVEVQDISAIRECVRYEFPNLIDNFDRGLRIPF